MLTVVHIQLLLASLGYPKFRSIVVVKLLVLPLILIIPGVYLPPYK